MHVSVVSSLLLAIVLAGPWADSSFAEQPNSQAPVKFARFKVGEQIMFGIVEGDTVRQIEGSIFQQWKPADSARRSDTY